MLNRGRAVALNTFRETVRDRIFYIVALFGLVLVGSSAVLSPLTVGAQGKIVTDVGLGAMTLFGLLVVVLVGSNLVRKELDKKTIITILTKPVGRREYILGKFCGLTMTLVCLLVVMALLFLLTLLISHVKPPPGLGAACYLAFLELAIINAAVLFFSTFVSPALAAMFTLGLFAIGHLTESIREFGQLLGNDLQAGLTEAIYFALPNLEVFNVRGAIVHGDLVPGQHLLIATLYSLAYVSLFLLLAGAVFSRREL